QLGLAVANYESANGSYPTADNTCPYIVGSSNLNYGASVFVRLLPYFEQSALFNAYNQSLAFFSISNATIANTGVNTLFCPSNTFLFGERAMAIFSPNTVATTQWAQRWWNSSWWPHRGMSTLYPPNAHRRLSSYINGQGMWWIPVEPASSMHPGGVNWAMCDG